MDEHPPPSPTAPGCHCTRWGNATGAHRATQDVEHPELWLQQREDQQSFMVWMLRMLPTAPALLGWLLGPQHCQDSLFTALHELDQVGEEHIPVALTEAVHVIRDLGTRRRAQPCAAVARAVECGMWGVGCGPWDAIPCLRSGG